MKILVTGSSGHLGEALMRMLRERGADVVGVDILPSVFTDHVGSIADRAFLARCMADVEAVLHTATLHKPHVATHSRQDFIDTNITGTLNLLEEGAARQVRAFVFTSTTSVFGDALIPPPGQPAAWITEDVVPAPKNIYGVTKAAAEDLCQLFHRNHGLPCIVLRTSRFFPEPDDSKAAREAFDDTNLKVVEYLYRRVDIEDAVSAHLLAIERVGDIGFGKYIISATTPFQSSDLVALRDHVPDVVRRYVDYAEVFASRVWRMPERLDRVYVNARARRDLGWQPKHDFASLIERLRRGDDPVSSLARQIGIKGYHGKAYADGLFPVE
ncbi:NAD(P)-dependent oxidoreductase [Asticcacaulis sp. BYS171W]|uniref:NAD(P)-dependent oxidoreductase n=1 Tax=Asticcacaulis aquaticus TaxID=2984212 RepID=A0ABT5HPQ7_9CAUL|nr:NAD(P)-dependent oxidoreductase [Asticcacaulis aquaticus]MDC7681969.1 NAD(P)-dependent oxidoreductase [Asticcacaulis aquaticus]